MLASVKENDGTDKECRDEGNQADSATWLNS
jgi:hypothetical protein